MERARLIRMGASLHDCQLARLPSQQGTPHHEKTVEGPPLWKPWKLLVRPGFTYGNRGWLWSEELRSKLDAKVRIGWFASFSTPGHVKGKPGLGGINFPCKRLAGGFGKRSHPILPNHHQSLCETKWPRRHDRSFLRRLLTWRSRAHNLFVQHLVAEFDTRRTRWKRR